MTTAITHEALAYIDSAIELAEQFMAEAADDHARDFAWQMRERGIMAIPLRDGFLPFEQARATLYLLRGLEKIEAQFYNAQPEEKAFDPTQPLTPQMRERVSAEVERQQTHLRQRLDKERQQSIGITQYRWLTQGDDKVRESHAMKDGQIFRWGEGEMPGQAFGCRCTAAPVLESMKLPNDPPIEPVYPIEELILSAALLGRAAKLGWDIVKRVREKLGYQKTPQEILMPNGEPYGISGNSPRVRIGRGGDKTARELYDELNKGGVPETPKGYQGEGTRLPNGDWVGYRPTSKSELPTVDVNIKGINLRKIHFLD